jgi:glycosyltransferase involved in cell wall biosynthesis
MIHSLSMAKRRSELPKISIVTPSFNQGHFLEQTIQSILSQGYPNLEYVIIDGGSRDNSVKIIKKYSSKLKYWVSKPDGGQAQAINSGFSHTSGQIMTWLNSDDILLPGTLKLVANIFTQLPEVNWLSGTPQTITQHGYIQHLGLRPVYLQKLIQAGWYHGRGLGFIMQEGTFWRRSLWKKSGGKVKNLHYGMDFDLWERFAELSPLIPVHVPLAAFRLNPERKSKAIDKYYQEIGMHLPEITAPLSKIARLSLQIPRKFRLTQQIRYDLPTETWQFYPPFIDRLLHGEQVRTFSMLAEK